jgi:hypothetical protein
MNPQCQAMLLDHERHQIQILRVIDGDDVAIGQWPDQCNKGPE